MVETKKILLIGRSGRGKSTLANVLLNKNDNFEEVFKESFKSVSETRKIQCEEFEDKANNIKYLVIDTPGIGDTKMSNDDVLDIIAEAVYLVRNGVSQVFFVISKRFDEYEMATYNLLRTAIFDEHITKHTTIVRTNFSKFKKEEECDKDIKLMKKESQAKKSELEEKITVKKREIEILSSDDKQYQKLLSEINQMEKESKSALTEIIDSCQSRVIHVDNPPLGIKGGSSKELELNKKKRNNSRQKVLEHLNSKDCKNIYNPSKLQKLSGEIVDYMEDKEKKRKELEEKREKLGLATKTKKESEGEKNENVRTSKDAEDESEKVSVENNKIESVVEKEDKGEANNNEKELKSSKINFKAIIKSDIASLEEKIKELEEAKGLQEELKEVENKIRGVIREHILNNKEEINNVLGGDILIKSITAKDNSDSSPDELDFSELRKKEEELGKQLEEKGVEDQTLEQIEDEIKKKERELLDLKKQLLNDEEIFKGWQKQGFNIQQIQEWADTLGRSFDPEKDAIFCAWLRDSKNIKTEGVAKDNVEQLRTEHDPQWRSKSGEVKKILLIGRSGQGKSTLANILVNKGGKFEEIFKESRGSVSKTRKIQAEQFRDEENNVNYLIIDTPGIGDTKMSDNEVLDIIAEAAYLTRNGVNQVFFVVDGRFGQYEMATYNLLRAVIFDKDITNHTTIVRTKFEAFEDEEECQKDVSNMIDQGGKLVEIIKSCRVIHVNNPSLGIINDEKELELNWKEEREKSREKLLVNLSKIYQETSYKPGKLKELSNAIVEDMNKLLQSRKELDEEMKKIKTNSESSSVNNQSLKTEDSKNKIEILPVKVNKFGINIEKDEAKDTPKNNSSLAIGERIKELEDKKTKLQREIAEKEKTIRQKILKCIFNNYKEISGELGDDIFLNSVTGKHGWENINREFNDKELVVEWLSNGFDFEQVQKWATALGNAFDPRYDTGFCTWLRDDKKLTVEKIKELIQVYSIEQLRKDYANQLEKETSIFDKHNQQLDQAENENESIKKSLLEVNPYEYDKFIASLYHFQPQDSFFKNNPNVRQNAFDNLGLKGIGKYDGKNWSIRPAGHDLTDKEWNIIHIKLKEGQWGWNEHGILIVNTKTKQTYFTSYSHNQQQEVKELQRMLEKYNLNNNRGNQPSNKGVTYNNPGRIYGQYGSDNTQDGVSYNFGSDNNQKNEKDVQIINPNINPWKGGHDLSYSTTYLTFFIEKLIQHLENSNELGDFTNLTYNHKERANEINKGLFSNFSNSIWVNSMNRWNYYQSLVKGTENYKNNIYPNQVQEVQEAYQRAQIGSSEFEKAQIQIPPK